MAVYLKNIGLSNLALNLNQKKKKNRDKRNIDFSVIELSVYYFI